jgi:hypothetical protein
LSPSAARNSRSTNQPTSSPLPLPRPPLRPLCLSDPPRPFRPSPSEILSTDRHTDRYAHSCPHHALRGSPTACSPPPPAPPHPPTLPHGQMPSVGAQSRGGHDVASSRSTAPPSRPHPLLPPFPFTPAPMSMGCGGLRRAARAASSRPHLRTGRVVALLPAPASPRQALGVAWLWGAWGRGWGVVGGGGWGVGVEAPLVFELVVGCDVGSLSSLSCGVTTLLAVRVQKSHG